MRESSENQFRAERMKGKIVFQFHFIIINLELKDTFETVEVVWFAMGAQTQSDFISFNFFISHECKTRLCMQCTFFS
jgi:hypothetical protein